MNTNQTYTIGQTVNVHILGIDRRAEICQDDNGLFLYILPTANLLGYEKAFDPSIID